MDAGTSDAGVVDLGLLDTGSLDATLDSGVTPDASPDAGAVDAGLRFNVASQIILITTTINGDPAGSTSLDARTAADGQCGTAFAAWFGSHNVDAPSSPVTYAGHALLCMSSDDEVQDMATTFHIPTDRVVVSGTTGATIAANWPALLTGLDVDLHEAGLVEDASTQFYSGCLPGGGVSIHNCTGFTSNEASVNGSVGICNETSADWLAWGNILSCDSVLPILCVIYI